jgi:hypothetical protein
MTTIDAHATLARVEQMIERLRTSYVYQGWKLDEEGAERTLKYFRSMTRRVRDNYAERQAAFDFLDDHGQSLDWIMAGTPVGMICRAARHSARAAA